MHRATNPQALRDQLRLVVLTDPVLAGPRSLESVVSEALAGGAGSIQLRDKSASARELYGQAQALLELTRRSGALLFVNDRVDVAVAAGADGVHLGPDDLSVGAARAWAPEGFLIGYSTDEPAAARAAASAGADYIGCGAVFGTTSKDVGGEAIGTERLVEVVRSVAIPVVAIGGIDTNNVVEVAKTGVAGVAVLSAIMAAPDPKGATRALLDAMSNG